MTARPRWALRGRGWTLSLQRRRAADAPGYSSNLGAAPLVPEGRGRATARLAPGERLWLAVSAPPGVKVEARLADGRALGGEVMEGGAEGPALHRLATGGIGAEDVAGCGSLTVSVGAYRVEIALLAAGEFDRRFGPVAAVEGEPAVYQGWRLP